MSLHAEPVISRRTLLQASAVSAIPFLLRTRQAAAEPLTGPIDAHVHIWTDDMSAYPLAPGYSTESVKPSRFLPEDLFTACRPEGVNRIVLIQMNFYEYDNRYMLDAIRKFPHVFRGVGIIDESLPTATQTMRELLPAGVTGFRLYATRKNAETWETSTAMQALWKCGAETRQAMCLLANPDALPSIRRLVEKFPETPVVIDHFARLGVTGTIDPAELDNLCGLAHFPNVFVKTSAFYALGKKHPPYTDLGPMVRRLRDAYGAERLMWASDCPYQVQAPHSYAESISLIRDRLDFLSAAEKSWILTRTAEKVFWGT